MKMVHNSQIVGAKDNLKLITVGQTKDIYQALNYLLKLYVRAINDSESTFMQIKRKL